MNVNKLMKQMQNMQKEMQIKQEEIKKKTIEVSVGGGVVTVKMTGGYEIIDLIINDDIIKIEEKDMLKDLIISAVNEARNKVDELNKEILSSMTGGLNIPGF